MKTKAWIGWAAAALAVQLAALGWLVACHERVVQKGEEVRIPCGAFDPSEPLRGRYLNVRAELECRDIESDTPLDEMDREARRRLCRKLVAKLEPAGDGTATHRVARLAMHPDGDGLWGLKATQGQEKLESLLGRILGQPVELAASGRTDAGVHAAGQTFTMGSPTDENPNRLASEVQHSVSFTKDYYLAIYETTRKQFATMGCTVAANYGAQDDPYPGDDADQTPIGRILYNNLRGTVENGIDWPGTGSTVYGDSYLATIRTATGLALDLPTEAQWEFACRAGTTTAMYNGKPNAGTWGNSDCNDIAWYTGTSEQKPHAVGGKLPNDWGFYDMYGNVREWCLDWYATYPASAVVDPNGPTSGTERVIRSSYYWDGSRGMRSAYRTSQYPRTADTTYGFRLCLPLQ